MGKEKRIKKAIESLEKHKEAHLEKMDKEGKNYALRDYWQKEIGKFEREIEKKKRKLNK